MHPHFTVMKNHNWALIVSTVGQTAVVVTSYNLPSHNTITRVPMRNEAKKKLVSLQEIVEVITP